MFKKISILVLLLIGKHSLHAQTFDNNVKITSGHRLDVNGAIRAIDSLICIKRTSGADSVCFGVHNNKLYAIGNIDTALWSMPLKAPNLITDSLYLRSDSVFYRRDNNERFAFRIITSGLQWTDSLEGPLRLATQGDLIRNDSLNGHSIETSVSNSNKVLKSNGTNYVFALIDSNNVVSSAAGLYSNIYRKTASDSVFGWKDGFKQFLYKDSIGTGGGGGAANPQGPEGSIQYRVGSSFAGSNFLIFDTISHSSFGELNILGRLRASDPSGNGIGYFSLLSGAPYVALGDVDGAYNATNLLVWDEKKAIYLYGDSIKIPLYEGMPSAKNLIMTQYGKLDTASLTSASGPEHSLQYRVGDNISGSQYTYFDTTGSQPYMQFTGSLAVADPSSGESRLYVAGTISHPDISIGDVSVVGNGTYYHLTDATRNIEQTNQRCGSLFDSLGQILLWSDNPDSNSMYLGGYGGGGAWGLRVSDVTFGPPAFLSFSAEDGLILEQGSKSALEFRGNESLLKSDSIKISSLTAGGVVHASTTGKVSVSTVTNSELAGSIDTAKTNAASRVTAGSGITVTPEGKTYKVSAINSGTVTSVATSAPILGGTITSTGTISADTSSANAALATNYKVRTTDSVGTIVSGIWQGDWVDDVLLAHQALGGSTKAFPIGAKYPTGASALASGTMNFVPVYVTRSLTVTGVKWFNSVASNANENNYNGLELFSISGGTLTMVDSTTRDSTTWTGSGAMASKAFAGGARTLSPGLYYIGLVYNSATQVTAPSVSISTNSLSGATTEAWDFTNSSKLYSTKTSVTAPITSQAMSGLTSNNTHFYLVLY